MVSVLRGIDNVIAVVGKDIFSGENGSVVGDVFLFFGFTLGCNGKDDFAAIKLFLYLCLRIHLLPFRVVPV